MSDGQLLEHFIAQRDEAAFTALVRRHGPMVLGVCQRLLQDSHEAEDALQATFIVLVRKAGSISKREVLGSWLYGVAYRVALKMRGATARRLVRTGQGEEQMATIATGCEPGWDDLCPMLDEEVQRLPSKYRTVVVLCYLEGKTSEEAAQELCCPPNTIKSRLARARQRLRQRLARRGLAFSAGGLAALLATTMTSAAVPPALVDSLGRTAAAMAAGAVAAETISPAVLTVVEGVLKTMGMNKLKMALALILTFGLLGSSALVLMPVADAQPAAEEQRPWWAAAPDPVVQDPKVSKAIEESGQKPKAAPPVGSKPKIETLWVDLLTTDETKVIWTVLALKATPKETVTFFKEHMRPVKVDDQRSQRLIADLDSKEFPARQKAEAELEYLGKYVRPQLRKALAANPSLEVKNRIEALIKRMPYDSMEEAGDLFAELNKDPQNQAVKARLIQVLRGQSNFDATAAAEKYVASVGLHSKAMPNPPSASDPSPLWVRAKRAIVVLEHIATPEARDLLKALADGEPEALPTKEAKAALGRLASPNAGQ